jgi:predicted small lipoprotein YifL
MKKTSLFCRISALSPVLGLAVLVLVVAGCGQKGPLYLRQPAKPSPDAPQAAPAPAAKQAATGY